jgi:hypothetical protein
MIKALIRFGNDEKNSEFFMRFGLDVKDPPRVEEESEIKQTE